MLSTVAMNASHLNNGSIHEVASFPDTSHQYSSVLWDNEKIGDLQLIYELKEEKNSEYSS